MKTRTAILVSIAVLLGAPYASAQSFLGKLKKTVKNAVKQEVNDKVTDKTTKVVKTTTGKSTSATSSKADTKTRSTGSTSSSLPADHTALFAPIGQAVDSKYGTKTVKAERPPKDETKQPDWNDARISVYELDNKSLVEEYLLLDECLNNKYFRATSPASARYSAVLDELSQRTKALEKMVDYYNEASDYEADGDTGFAKENYKLLAGILKGRPYKTLIRSSVAPFFTSERELIKKDVATYFNAHGGYENAHKAKFTVLKQ